MSKSDRYLCSAAGCKRTVSYKMLYCRIHTAGGPESVFSNSDPSVLLVNPDGTSKAVPIDTLRGPWVTARYSYVEGSTGKKFVTQVEAVTPQLYIEFEVGVGPVGAETVVSTIRTGARTSVLVRQMESAIEIPADTERVAVRGVSVTQVEPTLRGFVRVSSNTAEYISGLIRVEPRDLRSVQPGAVVYRYPDSGPPIYFAGDAGEAYVEIGTGETRIIRPLERMEPERPRPFARQVVGTSTDPDVRSAVQFLVSAIGGIGALITDVGGGVMLRVQIAYVDDLSYETPRQYRQPQRPQPLAPQFPLIGQHRAYFND